jgi:hypothetical protein
MAKRSDPALVWRGPPQILHMLQEINRASLHGWRFDQLCLEALHRLEEQECEHCASGCDCAHNAARVCLDLIELHKAMPPPDGS